MKQATNSICIWRFISAVANNNWHILSTTSRCHRFGFFRSDQGDIRKAPPALDQFDEYTVASAQSRPNAIIRYNYDFLHTTVTKASELFSNKDILMFHSLKVYLYIVIKLITDNTPRLCKMFWTAKQFH